jgi:DNA-binding FadR family transcriptional regulator
MTRRGLHHEAVEHIGSRIVSGALKEGEVLVEADLSNQIGISRSGIREAIKVLAAKGLIESRTKIGTSIRPRSAWNMLDPDILWWWSTSGDTRSFLRSVFDMRRLIEPGAAALAAERATDTEIARIAEAYERMGRSTGDIHQAARADRDFHIAIMEATENVILRSLGTFIETALIASFQVTSSLPQALANSLPLHGQVVDAITAHDPEAARHAVEMLLDDSWALLVRAFGDGSSKAPIDKVQA